jgi:hypothetical protein
MGWRSRVANTVAAVAALLLLRRYIEGPPAGARSAPPPPPYDSVLVTVPPNVRPGQQIELTGPASVGFAQMVATVPPHLIPGDQLRVMAPTSSSQAAPALLPNAAPAAGQPSPPPPPPLPPPPPTSPTPPPLPAPSPPPPPSPALLSEPLPAVVVPGSGGDSDGGGALEPLQCTDPVAQRRSHGTVETTPLALPSAVRSALLNGKAHTAGAASAAGYERDPALHSPHPLPPTTPDETCACARFRRGWGSAGEAAAPLVPLPGSVAVNPSSTHVLSSRTVLVLARSSGGGSAAAGSVMVAQAAMRFAAQLNRQTGGQVALTVCVEPAGTGTTLTEVATAERRFGAEAYIPGGTCARVGAQPGDRVVLSCQTPEPAVLPPVMQEGYSLHIGGDNQKALATLSAKNAVGVVRGLATLAQLVRTHCRCFMSVLVHNPWARSHQCCWCSYSSGPVARSTLQYCRPCVSQMRRRTRGEVCCIDDAAAAAADDDDDDNEDDDSVPALSAGSSASDSLNQCNRRTAAGCLPPLHRDGCCAGTATSMCGCQDQRVARPPYR